eukprot:3090427-Amphidinium_carterae.1
MPWHLGGSGHIHLESPPSKVGGDGSQSSSAPRAVRIPSGSEACPGFPLGACAALIAHEAHSELPIPAQVSHQCAGAANLSYGTQAG